MVTENFDKVYNAFAKKDYFHTKDRIKTQIGNWKRAIEKGDKGAKQYTEKDIISHMEKVSEMEARMSYEKLKKAIEKKDVDFLKSILRHDQLFAKALFADITGKKLPKSTRDIQTFLDDMFKNESVNESVSVFDERNFGKKGIIIMIDDNGKKTSAIFKDKKNADKFNRNNSEDVKKLLDLAKKAKYPNAIDEGGYSNVTKLGNINDPNSKFNRDKINLKKWNTYSPEKIMNFVYWGKGQVPPTNKTKFNKEWEKLKSQLQKKFPQTESMNESEDGVSKVVKYLKQQIKRGYLQRHQINQDEIYGVMSKLKIKLSKDEVDDVEFELDESVTESKPTSIKGKFSKQQLDKLRDEYGKLNRINPSSPSYKKMTNLLDIMNIDQLNQIYNADIPFLSSLAHNRIMRQNNK